MSWHVVYEDRNGQVQSRAARSRESAIHMACELLEQSHVVRRAVGPDGAMIERAKLEAHYDEGRFPGLRRGEMLLLYLMSGSGHHLAQVAAKPSA
ncbi:MAG TPA: hypothetical protein VKI44_05605 [Acetobacteraceae bacterium]|nr:hypothetical protein [Acetobacteraceae bacterium]